MEVIPMASAAGKEIAKHRVELEMILLRIMREHSERCREEGESCHWEKGALDSILCDLEKLLERYHVRTKAAEAAE
jgi:hypothetical protein